MTQLFPTRIGKTFMYRSLFLTGVVAVALAGPAFAADTDNGERLAQRWCATCHVVSPGQRQGSDRAPTFATIALMPGFSAEKIAFFLLVPHPKMPDMTLTRKEAEDIAAYIARLGK